MSGVMTGFWKCHCRTGAKFARHASAFGHFRHDYAIPAITLRARGQLTPCAENQRQKSTPKIAPAGAIALTTELLVLGGGKLWRLL